MLTGWGRKFSNFIRRFPKMMIIPYYAYRFIQPKYSVGVIGVVINSQDEILLVEHAFHPRRPWGLPGGWIGRNEDPASAVSREFYEELGIRVQVVQILKIEKTQRNHLDLAFLCSTEDVIQKMSFELLAYQWFQRQSLPSLHPFHLSAIQEAYEALA